MISMTAIDLKKASDAAAANSDRSNGGVCSPRGAGIKSPSRQVHTERQVRKEKKEPLLVANAIKNVKNNPNVQPTATSRQQQEEQVKQTAMRLAQKRQKSLQQPQQNPSESQKSSKAANPSTQSKKSKKLSSDGGGVDNTNLQQASYQEQEMLKLSQQSFSSAAALLREGGTVNKDPSSTNTGNNITQSRDKNSANLVPRKTLTQQALDSGTDTPGTLWARQQYPPQQQTDDKPTAMTTSMMTFSSAQLTSLQHPQIQIIQQQQQNTSSEKANSSQQHPSVVKHKISNSDRKPTYKNKSSNYNGSSSSKRTYQQQDSHQRRSPLVQARNLFPTTTQHQQQHQSIETSDILKAVNQQLNSKVIAAGGTSNRSSIPGDAAVTNTQMQSGNNHSRFQQQPQQQRATGSSTKKVRKSTSEVGSAVAGGGGEAIRASGSTGSCGGASGLIAATAPNYSNTNNIYQSQSQQSLQLLQQQLSTQQSIQTQKPSAQSTTAVNVGGAGANTNNNINAVKAQSGSGEESQFQMRVREILNNLPTSSRNRERFTINRTSIKKSAVKLIDPFTNMKTVVGNGSNSNKQQIQQDVAATLTADSINGGVGIGGQLNTSPQQPGLIANSYGGGGSDAGVNANLEQYPELQDLISLTQNVQTISQQMSDEKEQKQKAAAAAAAAALLATSNGHRQSIASQQSQQHSLSLSQQRSTHHHGAGHGRLKVMHSQPMLPISLTKVQSPIKEGDSTPQRQQSFSARQSSYTAMATATVDTRASADASTAMNAKMRSSQHQQPPGGGQPPQPNNFERCRQQMAVSTEQKNRSRMSSPSSNNQLVQLSAQKVRRSLPKLSPRGKNLQEYQHHHNYNIEQQTSTTGGSALGKQQLLFQAQTEQIQNLTTSSVALASNAPPTSQQQLPLIQKSHSQQKLSSRQRYVMQKYNMPYPGGFGDASTQSQINVSAVVGGRAGDNLLTERINTGSSQPMIGGGAASSKQSTLVTGGLPGNLNITSGQGSTSQNMRQTGTATTTLSNGQEPQLQYPIWLNTNTNNVLMMPTAQQPTTLSSSVDIASMNNMAMNQPDNSSISQSQLHHLQIHHRQQSPSTTQQQMPPSGGPPRGSAGGGSQSDHPLYNHSQTDCRLASSNSAVNLRSSASHAGSGANHHSSYIPTATGGFADVTASSTSQLRTISQPQQTSSSPQQLPLQPALGDNSSQSAAAAFQHATQSQHHEEYQVNPDGGLLQCGGITFKERKYRIDNLYNLFQSPSIASAEHTNDNSQVNSIFQSNKQSVVQQKKLLIRKNSTQNMECTTITSGRQGSSSNQPPGGQQKQQYVPSQTSNSSANNQNQQQPQQTLHLMPRDLGGRPSRHSQQASLQQTDSRQTYNRHSAEPVQSQQQQSYQHQQNHQKNLLQMLQQQAAPHIQSHRQQPSSSQQLLQHQSTCSSSSQKHLLHLHSQPNSSALVNNHQHQSQQQPHHRNLISNNSSVVAHVDHHNHHHHHHHHHYSQQQSHHQLAAAQHQTASSQSGAGRSATSTSVNLLSRAAANAHFDDKTQLNSNSVHGSAAEPAQLTQSQQIAANTATLNRMFVKQKFLNKVIVNHVNNNGNSNKRSSTNDSQPPEHHRE